MNDEFKIPESFFSPPAEMQISAMPSPPAPATLEQSSTTESEPWPSRLPFEVALGVDSAEMLMDRHELTEEQFGYLLSNSLFLRAVEEHRTEIKANGVSFRAKAKVQAEMYLAELHSIVTNPSVSAPTRLDAIKAVVKYADLEPKPAPTGTAGTAAGQQTTRIVFAWQDGTNQMAVEVKNSALAPEVIEIGND